MLVRTILVNLRDYLFMDAIALALSAEGCGDLVVQKVPTPSDLPKFCLITEPYAVLLEVTGDSPYTLKERMELREQIRDLSKACKIVLLVDENADKNITEHVRQAKKDGCIDLFLYGSVSASYLAALMDTL